MSDENTNNISDEQWNALREYLNGNFSAANIRKLYGKLQLDQIPKGKNAKIRTIERILVVPTNGLPRSETAIKANASKRKISGTPMEVARRLLLNGFVTDYYKVVPQTGSSWYETIHEIIRVHELGPVTSEYLNSLAVTRQENVQHVVPAQNETTNGSVQTEAPSETSNSSVQTETVSADAGWYECISKVKNELNLLDIVLSLESINFNELLMFRNKLNLCIEDINLVNDFSSLILRENLRECNARVEILKTLFENKSEELQIHYERSIEDVNKLSKLMPVSRECTESVKIILSEYDSFKAVTGVTAYEKIISEFKSAIQGKRSLDPDQDEQENTNKKQKL